MVKKYKPKRLPRKSAPLTEKLMAYFEDATLDQIFNFFSPEGEAIDVDEVLDGLTELCFDLDWDTPSTAEEAGIRGAFEDADENDTGMVDIEEIAIVFGREIEESEPPTPEPPKWPIDVDTKYYKG